MNGMVFACEAQIRIISKLDIEVYPEPVLNCYRSHQASKRSRDCSRTASHVEAPESAWSTAKTYCPGSQDVHSTSHPLPPPKSSERDGAMATLSLEQAALCYALIIGDTLQHRVPACARHAPSVAHDKGDCHGTGTRACASFCTLASSKCARAGLANGSRKAQGASMCTASLSSVARGGNARGCSGKTWRMGALKEERLENFDIGSRRNKTGL